LCRTTDGGYFKAQITSFCEGGGRVGPNTNPPLEKHTDPWGDVKRRRSRKGNGGRVRFKTFAIPRKKFRGRAFTPSEGGDLILGESMVQAKRETRRLMRYGLRSRG